MSTRASEEHVRIAAKLYDARDTMRRFHRDQYAARVAEVRPYIDGFANKYGVSTLVAAQQMAKKAADDHNDFMALLVLATAVEMIEPSVQP